LSFVSTAKGLLHSLSAIPQYAIPHVASFVSTALNPSMARLNWKECNSATAWLNSCCAASSHDVAKYTVPNFSPFVCGWSCGSPREASTVKRISAMGFALTIRHSSSEQYNRGAGCFAEMMTVQ
jgi:hypothetical protein